jgi:hypothetical protein
VRHSSGAIARIPIATTPRESFLPEQRIRQQYGVIQPAAVSWLDLTSHNHLLANILFTDYTPIGVFWQGLFSLIDSYANW